MPTLLERSLTAVWHPCARMKYHETLPLAPVAGDHAPQGKTPARVLSPAKRCRIHLISVITNQGKLRFTRYRETLDAYK